MFQNTSFTSADINSRIENSNNQWEHFANTGWSLRCTHDGTLLISLRIDAGVFTDDYTWEANGIIAEITNSYDENQLNLQISTSNINSSALLRDLLLNFLTTKEEDPHAVIETLELRRYLWGRIFTGRLDSLAAQGLFGELYFMCRVLDNDLAQTIQHWDGPNRSLNDFNWPIQGIHIEVKTSNSVAAPLEHVVSSINQLQTVDDRSLFLFSMSARMDQSGQLTLNSLISEIEADLVQNQEFEKLGLFYEKLGEIGWNPTSEDFRFIVDEDLSNLYIVRDTFPRLTPANLSFGLDERIDIGSYKLTMSSLGDYKIEIQNTVDLNTLREIHNSA